MEQRADPPFTRRSIDEVDLAKYDRLGDEWWDSKGPMGALHKFNPIRVGWIRDLLRAGASRTALPGGLPLAGLRILDVGCGGGILSESLARLGAGMVGIDPAPNNIAVAARHAESEGVAVDYRCTTLDALARTGETFDAVLVMEVIEHVRGVPEFLRDAAGLVKPGGLLVGATLNRTAKSYALAIVGAEYVLRWLPRGTHDWSKFITPAEFGGHLARLGLDADRRGGRHLQPTARPLAAVVGPRLQLHDRRATPLAPSHSSPTARRAAGGRRATRGSWADPTFEVGGVQRAAVEAGDGGLVAGTLHRFEAHQRIPRRGRAEHRHRRADQEHRRRLR